MLIMAIILAALWGAVWAAILQFTDWGRFLAVRRAWLAVVIGFGVDLLILLAILPVNIWLQVCAIVSASSVGIIIRSLANEWREHMALLEGLDGDPNKAR